jgi:hypothetical protein
VGEEEQPTVPVDAIKADGNVQAHLPGRGGQAFELVVRTGVTKDGRIAVLEPLAWRQGHRQPPPGLSRRRVHSAVSEETHHAMAR